MSLINTDEWVKSETQIGLEALGFVFKTNVRMRSRVDIIDATSEKKESVISYPFIDLERAKRIYERLSNSILIKEAYDCYGNPLGPKYAAIYIGSILTEI